VFIGVCFATWPVGAASLPALLLVAARIRKGRERLYPPRNQLPPPDAPWLVPSPQPELLDELVERPASLPSDQPEPEAGTGPNDRPVFAASSNLHGVTRSA
jgi:hypothetical protein